MIRHAVVDGPRAVRPAEFAETLALCNRVLRPNGPPTIAEEYPLVLASANAAQLWIMTLDDRVVSHAGTYASAMTLDDRVTLRLGGVSSVATEPNARHRGYASRLVEACCADLQRRGCHFAVLWTEVHAFYQRLGFALLGAELLYRLSSHSLRSGGAGAETAAYTPADLDEVATLRAAVRPYTHRSRAEWQALLGIPKMQVWVARRGGRCVAYIVVGKGEDFRNCCHEWAGDADDVIRLLEHAAVQSRRREVILLTPDDAGPLNTTLQERGAPHIRTDLGMFRCLDPVGTLDAVRPMVEPRLGCSVGLEPAGEGWLLHVGETTVGPITTGDFSALLLGPRRATELLDAPPAVCAQLERGLPLPLFIWGLDSV